MIKIYYFFFLCIIFFYKSTVCRSSFFSLVTIRNNIHITIWAPHTQKDIMALEKVQRNTARFVYNNYSHYASVSEMLRCLNWSTLAQGRNEQKLTMMYKIVHQLVDIQASSYLIPATTIEYTRGHHMRFTQPFTRIDSYLYSFFPSSIKLWNALPNHILNSTNIEQFKQRIAGLSIN